MKCVESLSDSEISQISRGPFYSMWLRISGESEEGSCIMQSGSFSLILAFSYSLFQRLLGCLQIEISERKIYTNQNEGDSGEYVLSPVFTSLGTGASQT